MKLKVYFRGFISYWLERHCTRYKDKLDRQADERAARDQAAVDDP